MNRCFDDKSRFDSNNRSYKKVLPEVSVVTKKRFVPGTSLLERVRTTLALRVSARVLNLCRAAALALTLVLFVGIIGAMERGTLGFGRGMLWGTVILGVEYLALRSIKKNDCENEEEEA